MKNIVTLLIFSFLLAFQHFIFNSEKIKAGVTREFKDSVFIANLCFVGDLMCHSTQFKYAKVDKDSFDFTGVYKEVKFYLSSPDLTIGNLETVIAGKNKGYSGYPYFNAPEDFIYALKDAGFDLLITANNHALDQGWEGVERTIAVLKENKIHRTGTFTSEQDRDSVRIIEINSIRVAVLAYSENTNGLPIPKGKSFIINIIDEELIKNDILKARSNGADLIVVHLHYGPEYEREPSDYQKQTVKKIIELGADIIIGGHPHVIQPVDFFKTNNGKIDTGFVAYSLGNFISNQRWRYSDAGVILNIQIHKNVFSDSIYISKVNFLPTWVFRGQTSRGREYIILPSEITEADSGYDYIKKNDWKLLKQAYSDTKEVIKKYSDKPIIHSIK